MLRPALLITCLLATAAFAAADGGPSTAPERASPARGRVPLRPLPALPAEEQETEEADGGEVMVEEEEAEDEGPDLEARVAALEESLAQNKLVTDRLNQRLEAASAVQVQFFGYIDVGFFAVGGNGSGVRKDLGRMVPGTGDLLASWVFIGDPLSTAINSRGDVADLGDSRAIHFDPIHSQGRPSFLVNAVNLGLSGAIGDELTMQAMIDFLPRDALITGAALGDFIDVKLAWARWERPLGPVRFALSAGKFDSLHGLEYRAQEANTRLTVTPSLMCRYTCGRAVGLKAQLFLLEGALEAAVSLTNGSNQQELFPWANESDWNGFKTVSARLLGRVNGLELTVSGMIGAQDRQPDDTLLQWHVGGGARLTRGNFLAQAEFMGGRSPGKMEGGVPCAAASCIVYLGAYGLFAYKIAQVVSPYLRVDWRNSSMRAGRQYAYESNELRATVGLRVEPVKRLALKAEYTFNTELFGVPFDDNVFTSSVVASW